MDHTGVKLILIDEGDFTTYLESQITQYAEDKIRAGTWNENEAIDLSRESFAKLLPDGRNTVGHSIMTITDEATTDKVGILWVEWKNMEHKSSYIWDLVIYEKYRRRNYGTRALKSLEKMVKDRGLSSITLHVFGHNKPAVSLYKSLGYFCTDMIMKREL
jgi:ribosomal protein S18 acetylase RimI-like enzyme